MPTNEVATYLLELGRICSIKPYSSLQAFCALQWSSGQPLAARAMPAPLLLTEREAYSS